jgi:hypothetical protein
VAFSSLLLHVQNQPLAVRRDEMQRLVNQGWKAFSLKTDN